MKREAFKHPKVSRLARLLDVPKYAARGLLEGLWNMAGLYAPDGGVGVQEDADIADHLDWDGEAASLVDAFVGAGLLDRVEGKARLMVHDWADHCEDRIHAQLARSRKTFADGEPPRPLKLSANEKSSVVAHFESCSEWTWVEADRGRGLWLEQPTRPATADPAANGCQRRPAAASGDRRQPEAAESSLPNPTRPDHTQPHPTQPDPTPREASTPAAPEAGGRENLSRLSGSGGRAGPEKPPGPRRTLARALSAMGINRRVADELEAEGMTLERATRLLDEVRGDPRVHDAKRVFVKRARDELGIKANPKQPQTLLTDGDLKAAEQLAAARAGQGSTR